MALFAQDFVAWFILQAKGMNLMPTGLRDIPLSLVGLPFLLGLVVGAVTLPITQGQRVRVALLAMPFFVLATINNVGVAVYFGMPPPPVVTNPWIWLHTIALPAGIFIGASIHRQPRSAA